MSRPRTSSALVAAMRADYEAGDSLEIVARKHGLRSAGAVRTIFVNHGIPRRPRPKGQGNGRARVPLAEVKAIHAAWLGGMGLRAACRTHGAPGRDAGVMRSCFKRHGLPLKARPARPPRWGFQANGAPAPFVPKTEAEIEAIIQRATKLQVPHKLDLDWRHWTLERRADFIQRMKARIPKPHPRPTTPFSSNVKPFDYGTPEAHEIAKRMNAGRTSRTKLVQIRFASEGVIALGALWFWAGNDNGYMRGPVNPMTGRRETLHHRLWEMWHGREVPKHGVIIQIDGNKNNLDPENLKLVTRNDICRANQSAAITRKARAQTAALLKRAKQKQAHDLISTIQKQRA